MWSQCDNNTPCASCIRRGQHCQRLVRGSKELRPTTSVQPLVSSPRPRSMNNGPNLLHLKLFHHFQTFTVHTLQFSPSVWEHALQLSFQFDFLADAILCLAAQHLAVLQPESAASSTAATTHLSRALSKFRHELASKEFTSTHIDAFIATSLLLQYQLWTNTEDYVLPKGGGGPSGDVVFNFSSSLKKVFLKCIPSLLDQPSVFMPFIRLDSKDMLVEAAQISDGTLTAYENVFSYNRRFDAGLLSLSLPYTRGSDVAVLERWRYTPPKIAGVHDPIEDGYTPIIRQLCLIQSFLPEAQPPESASAGSPLFPELVKYILSFPVMCHGPLNSMIQNGDPHALLLLCHFYRAVRIILEPSQCWWVHKRATVCAAALKEWLIRKGAESSENQ
jgi:hypothetical protein